MFGAKRDEAAGEWRKVHNKELNDLCSLPNIVRVVKSGTLRWAGHVASMVEDGVVHWGVVGGTLMERGHWGHPDVDRRIILSWIFRKLERIVGTGWSWLRIGTGGGHL
jgi:hypothetical protein